MSPLFAVGGGGDIVKEIRTRINDRIGSQRGDSKPHPYCMCYFSDYVLLEKQ